MTQAEFEAVLIEFAKARFAMDSALVWFKKKRAEFEAAQAAVTPEIEARACASLGIDGDTPKEEYIPRIIQTISARQTPHDKHTVIIQ